MDGNAQPVIFWLIGFSRSHENSNKKVPICNPCADKCLSRVSRRLAQECCQQPKAGRRTPCRLRPRMSPVPPGTATSEFFAEPATGECPCYFLRPYAQECVDTEINCCSALHRFLMQNPPRNLGSFTTKCLGDRTSPTFEIEISALFCLNRSA